MCFDGIVEYSVRKRTDAVVYIRTQYVSTNLSLFSFFFLGGWGGACLSFLWLSASDILVHFVFVFIIVIIFFFWVLAMRTCV
jgi:NADH:ubiquinone oxidoreductase subunit H